MTFITGLYLGFAVSLAIALLATTSLVLCLDGNSSTCGLLPHSLLILGAIGFLGTGLLLSAVWLYGSQDQETDE